MEISYYAYSFHPKPIYYALKIEDGELREFIWNGQSWAENEINYLIFLRSEGNPFLDEISEEEISRVAGILV
jgi:hypothetical protein